MYGSTGCARAIPARSSTATTGRLSQCQKSIARSGASRPRRACRHSSGDGSAGGIWDPNLRIAPLPLAGGVGGGHWSEMPQWKQRHTSRARSLRNQATPAERALWTYLSRRQLSVKFSRQMPVGPYFADFLCRELKLIVELDGHSHDVAPGRDATRDRWMHDAGYTVLRFTNEDVSRNMEGVVSSIREAIARLRS